MSYKISKVSKTMENKPYCKVCHDAGKDESEFRSHSVRSKPDYYGKTVVICPTLLATECTYCYKKGHTVKFCPVISSNKKQENKIQAQNIRKEKEEKQQKKVSKPKSGFSVLADSSSDSEKPVQKSDTKKPAATKPLQKSEATKKPDAKKDEFPALSSVKKEVKPAAITGWAAITAKSAEQFQDEKKMQEIMEKSIKRMQPPIVKTTKPVKKNWADWSDSDDEEEEEEEKYIQYKNP
jgi:hypothetical protein